MSQAPKIALVFAGIGALVAFGLTQSDDPDTPVPGPTDESTLQPADAVAAPAVPEPASSGYLLALESINSQIARFEERVAAAPTDWTRVEPLVATLMERARLTGEFSNYTIAEAALDAAFRHAVEGSGPIGSRMQLNFTLHRFEQVRADLQLMRAAVLHTPGTRRTIAGMDAQLLLVSGRGAEAVTALDAIVSRDPSPPALSTAAIAHWKLGHFDEAEALLLLAAEGYHAESQVTPAWIELHRGLLDFERGRLEDALVHYRAADQLLSGWWLIEEHIAEALVESGELEEAEDRYREIVVRTELPEFMSALAELTLNLGENEASLSWARRAEAAYTERMALFPEAVTGHALDHWIAFGQPARAVELAEQNAANSPNGDALTQLVLALLRAEDFEAAAAAADRAVATGFSSADLHAAAASAFTAASRESDAEAQRGMAQSIDPRLREF